MNTNSLASATRTEVEGPDDALAVADERRLRESERFAQAILPSLLAFTKPRESLGVGATEPGCDTATTLTVPTKDWRPGDGALTAGQSLVEGRGAGAAGSPEAENDGRLIAHLDTPELGKMSLIVERSSSGLKVMLAVDDAFAAASADARRGELVQALRATGLAVASVTVSRTGAAGMTLAQPSAATRINVLDTSDSASQAEQDTPQPRAGAKRRRLNLTG